MIETRRCLKNVEIFIQTILTFVLSGIIINIYNDIARKCGNVTVKDFRKYVKLEYKNNELNQLSQQWKTTRCVSEIPYL